MQGPIRPITRDRVERRDDARLPSAWVAGQSTVGAVPQLSWLSNSQQLAAPVGGEAPVLVMLGAKQDAALDELCAHASAGGHVYVLVSPGWGEGGVDPRLLHAPRVLVRSVPEVPAAAVHAPDGARLWIGGTWSLRLDPAQADALRQVFLRLFWHEAIEEAWSGGRRLAWRVAGERPFDVPELPASAPVRLLAPDAHPELDAKGARVHTVTGGPPEVAPQRLWFPAGAEHHDRLSRLVRGGTEVAWADRNLPDLVVGNKAGEALLPGSRARLRLLLTPAQVEDVARILDAPAQWRFRVDLRIGDPGHQSSRFWLPGAAMAHVIEPEQRIDVPGVQATSLRAMADTSPATVPEPQPLALTARYSWTVEPPRLPAGADEDPLVGCWRKLDEDWASRLSRVRDALHAADGHRGRIGRGFSRLVSAMLGFERTHSGLGAEVTSMAAQRPSAAGPAGAPAMLSRLTSVEERATKLQVDLEEAERQAREDEEREKQEAAWQSRAERAKRELPVRKTALSDAEGRRPVISAELSAIQESLKTAAKNERKNLSASRRKLSDDFTRLNKEIGRLRAEVADREQRIAEPFEFRAPSTPAARSAQRKARFVPSASTTRSGPAVPNEALPKVGALQKHSGQRYLAIHTWEELSAGEQAAVRLSAKLVGPEDA